MSGKSAGNSRHEPRKDVWKIRSGHFSTVCTFTFDEHEDSSAAESSALRPSTCPCVRCGSPYSHLGSLTFSRNCPWRLAGNVGRSNICSQLCSRIQCCPSGLENVPFLLNTSMFVKKLLMYHVRIAALLYLQCVPVDIFMKVSLNLVVYNVFALCCST